MLRTFTDYTPYPRKSLRATQYSAEVLDDSLQSVPAHDVQVMFRPELEQTSRADKRQ